MVDHILQKPFQSNKRLQSVYYIIILWNLINQTLGVSLRNNHSSIIWSLGEFPYIEDYLKVDELSVTTSLIRMDNKTSICLGKNFNDQPTNLSNISIAPTTSNKEEKRIPFECFISNVSDNLYNIGVRQENISVLTWSLHAAPDGFSEDEVIATITHSFFEWSYEIPVDFNYIGRYMNANITISFHISLNHAILYKNQSIYCSSAFDLADIAHAAPIDHTYDRIRGQIHFNGYHRTWSM